MVSAGAAPSSRLIWTVSFDGFVSTAGVDAGKADNDEAFGSDFDLVSGAAAATLKLSIRDESKIENLEASRMKDCCCVGGRGCKGGGGTGRSVKVDEDLNGEVKVAPSSGDLR